MLFRPKTVDAVARRIFVSNQSPLFCTYFTSRLSFCSLVREPLPLIWASPVRPGFTSSLCFCCSVHSGICETYKGLGPTSDIWPLRTLYSCGNSSSDRSLRNRPVGVSLGSSPDFGLLPNGSTSVVMVRNLYSVNGFAFRRALCCLKTAGPLLESLISMQIRIIRGDRIIRATKDAKISKLLLRNLYNNSCPIFASISFPVQCSDVWL